MYMYLIMVSAISECLFLWIALLTDTLGPTPTVLYFCVFIIFLYTRECAKRGFAKFEKTRELLMMGWTDIL